MAFCCWWKGNYLEVNEAASSITATQEELLSTKYGDYQLEGKREDALIQFQQLLKKWEPENLLQFIKMEEL
jgi:hypothetical protein